MAHTIPVFGLGREFDAFLSAPVGEEPNGMLLSVISALARSDIDPWQEAAHLAHLPAQSATQRLSSLIAALPGARLDSGAIASRLVALLPHAGTSTAGAAGTLSAGMSNQIVSNRSVITFAIVWAVMLGIQSIVASHQQPPQAASAVASAPGQIAPPTAKAPTGP